MLWQGRGARRSLTQSQDLALGTGFAAPGLRTGRNPLVPQACRHPGLSLPGRHWGLCQAPEQPHHHSNFQKVLSQNWPLPAISGQPAGTCLCAGILQGLQRFGAGTVPVGQPFSRWTPAWRASSLSTSTDSRPPSSGHSLCTPSRLSSSLFKSRCSHWRRKTFYKRWNNEVPLINSQPTRKCN